MIMRGLHMINIMMLCFALHAVAKERWDRGQHVAQTILGEKLNEIEQLSH
jgi:hypothetical protein